MKIGKHWKSDNYFSLHLKVNYIGYNKLSGNTTLLKSLFKYKLSVC